MQKLCLLALLFVASSDALMLSTSVRGRSVKASEKSRPADVKKTVRRSSMIQMVSTWRPLFLPRANRNFASLPHDPNNHRLTVTGFSLCCTQGEQSTRRQNEWKYVKGINDYGKEQTYMYLAERKGSEDDLMGTPLSEMAGLDLGRWSFVATPYFIALFAPLALCTLSIGSKYIA